MSVSAWLFLAKLGMKPTCKFKRNFGNLMSFWTDPAQFRNSTTNSGIMMIFIIASIIFGLNVLA